MKIGIVGSNERAVAIGRLLSHGGHEVTFGDTTSERANQAAAKLGSKAEMPYKQAMTSDILVLALPPQDVDRAIAAVGSGIRAVVVDAIEDNTPNEAELLARKLDTHDVVRAIIERPQPGANVSICGDDVPAKETVDRALQTCGCVTTDRGPLANAAQLQPHAA